MNDITIPDPLPPAVIDRDGLVRVTMGNPDRYLVLAEKFGPLTDLYPRDHEPEPETVWRAGDSGDLLDRLLAHARGSGLGYKYVQIYFAEGLRREYRFPFVLPEKPEWADALVIRWDGVVWAKDWGGGWRSVSRSGWVHTKQIIESNQPVTVLVDADGEVVR